MRWPVFPAWLRNVGRSQQGTCTWIPQSGFGRALWDYVSSVPTAAARSRSP